MPSTANHRLLNFCIPESHSENGWNFALLQTVKPPERKLAARNLHKIRNVCELRQLQKVLSWHNFSPVIQSCFDCSAGIRESLPRPAPQYLQSAQPGSAH